MLLYLLLMEERYGQDVDKGLLWYLGQVPPSRPLTPSPCLPRPLPRTSCP